MAFTSVPIDFNSIKVRLELNFSLSPMEMSPNFNSIKVRLEPGLFASSFASHFGFQFHKGAIRTRKVLGVDVLRIYGFVGAKIQKNLQKNVDA